MINVTHLRYEVLRTFRNRLFLGLTIGLPLVLFYAVTSANINHHVDGVSFALYFMTAMAAYGSMYAVVAPGGRTAADRARGWTRQLRITPLRARTALLSKAVAAYLLTLPTLIVIGAAGASLGVRLSAAAWAEMAGLLLVGLLPIAVMGILVGYLMKVEVAPLAIGGPVVLLALLGGEFGPLFNGGVMLTIVKLLPSYWLAQAGRVGLGGGGWPVEAWVVVAVWTLAMAALAAVAYRRDTQRV
jgi:ABC-2 type transport system permease protein